VIIFFFASAGASAAYLTVSEIFPMETRAMAIAFFYAIGTGVGGISGPVLFGALIASGKRGDLTIGYLIGAVLMIGAGLVEVWLGPPSYRHWSPMLPPYSAPLIDTARGREIDEIIAALSGAGPLERRRLAQLVHASLWGPAGSLPRCARQSPKARYAAPAGACMRSRPQRRVPVRIR
jgi:MFS family permease